MALLDSEIARIKAELGFNVLDTGALPYIGITQVFEQVIQNNVLSGASTTSATAVTAATTPTPVTITLTAGTGFTAGDRVVVDVDDRQEIVTAQTVSGASLTVQLSKAHSGTYPVTVEGGESIIRDILRQIRAVKSALAASAGEGSVKRVDELEFYQTGMTTAGSLESQLRFWRDELSMVLGVPSLWSRRAAGAQRLAVY